MNQGSKYCTKPLRKRIGSTLLRGAIQLLSRTVGILQSAIAVLNYLRLRYMDFVPRPDDIFIVTCPRSGTTWMQNILYQLTTDGDIESFVLDEFSPYFEYPHAEMRDYEELPSPRILKSHLPYRYMPKAKCIYVARDGRDVAVSYFHSHLNRKMPFCQFFELFLQNKTDWLEGYFEHVRGWYAHKDDPNILFLKYEDLSRDLAGSVRKVIDFCGFEIPPERLPGILERCSFAYMREHQLRFTPGFQPGRHIRKGKTRGWNEYLSPEQNARYEAEFELTLGRLGLDFK